MLHVIENIQNLNPKCGYMPHSLGDEKTRCKRKNDPMETIS